MSENRNLSYFRNLLNCGQTMYSWCYKTQPEFIQTYSNCLNETVRQVFLSMNLDIFYRNPSCDKSRPYLITTDSGLMWVVDFEPDQPDVFHAIGPVLFSDTTIPGIQQWLMNRYHSLELVGHFIEALNDFPVLSITRMMDYALMLHYTLSGNYLNSHDIILEDFSADSAASGKNMEEEHTHPTHKGNWAIEQHLMKLIEDGNLNYKEEMQQINQVENIGSLGNGAPLRHIKNWIIIYTALCCRAAIRGGLDPETAYTLSDRYIEKTEQAKDIREVTELEDQMLGDYIQRVHKAKVQDGVSGHIQRCCNYIELHPEEKLDVEFLANYCGYSPNYLSKKFQKEMHMTPSAFIQQQKIAYAKILLRTTQLSILTISENLSYSSQSHFGEQFKRLTGMTPGEYRSSLSEKKPPSRA